MKPYNPYAGNQQPEHISDLLKAYIFDNKRVQVLEIVKKRSLTDLRDYYLNFIYKHEMNSDEIELILANDLN
jgi:hypothetical protein